VHSYVIVTNDKSRLNDKLSELIPFEDHESSPDFLRLDEEGSLGIDAIRDVQKFLSLKPYKESVKVVHVLEAGRLTPPAQQAFLKTLEEPPDNSLLILSLVNESLLLPTIISRCEVIRLTPDNGKEELDRKKREEISKLISEVVSLGVGDRALKAQEYAFPKTKALDFLSDLIAYFRAELKNNPNKNCLHNLKLANKAHDRLVKNVDPRLTLEHLFINLV